VWQSIQFFLHANNVIAYILALAFVGLYGYGIFVGFKLSAGDGKQFSPIQAPAARTIQDISNILHRAALAELEKKINSAGAKWAGIDEGRAEMKKVHHAEKELDQGHRCLEVVRKVTRKESRFESVNYCIFLFDPLEHDQLKGVAV